MRKIYHVYILASYKRGTLYIGVTGNLVQRMEQHRNGQVKGFAQKYQVYRLVYIEAFYWVYDALYREKQLKKWERAWKVRLIESLNPSWKDLVSSL